MADQATFAEQAMPYMDQLFAHAMRMTRNRADAEDLVQETYLRGYREGIDCARRGIPPPRSIASQPPEYRIGFDAGRYWWWIHLHRDQHTEHADQHARGA
jgi:hypothetical protein